MNTTQRTPVRNLKVLAMVAAGALLLAACGSSAARSQTVTPSAASTASVARVIDIEMVDIAFTTKSIDVAAGETIHFVFKNMGTIRHEAVIGDQERQDEHEMEMTAPGASQMNMAEEGKISLEPGTSGSVDYTFDTAGTFLIGCHEPGHYPAGMVVTVNVL